ncbi:hypothetical protein H2199_002018 [Coniosporium tulheliwenetii]|uniref:Uncharacterized protein n=1 Tax=Coniosporium tulheliwenetii TaxID=3383036 RepID=A0ACC2ZHN9_9PEZI|nr:hypothetical protein H2199_002018 [Cladosporium sp. JES 115]
MYTALCRKRLRHFADCCYYHRNIYRCRDYQELLPELAYPTHSRSAARERKRNQDLDINWVVTPVPYDKDGDYAVRQCGSREDRRLLKEALGELVRPKQSRQRGPGQVEQKGVLVDRGPATRSKPSLGCEEAGKSGAQNGIQSGIQSGRESGRERESAAQTARRLNDEQAGGGEEEAWDDLDAARAESGEGREKSGKGSKTIKTRKETLKETSEENPGVIAPKSRAKTFQAPTAEETTQQAAAAKARATTRKTAAPTAKTRQLKSSGTPLTLKPKATTGRKVTKATGTTKAPKQIVATKATKVTKPVSREIESVAGLRRSSRVREPTIKASDPEAPVEKFPRTTTPEPKSPALRFPSPQTPPPKPRARLALPSFKTLTSAPSPGRTATILSPRSSAITKRSTRSKSAPSSTTPTTPLRPLSQLPTHPLHSNLPPLFLPFFVLPLFLLPPLAPLPPRQNTLSAKLNRLPPTRYGRSPSSPARPATAPTPRAAPRVWVPRAGQERPHTAGAALRAQVLRTTPVGRKPLVLRASTMEEFENGVGSLGNLTPKSPGCTAGGPEGEEVGGLHRSPYDSGISPTEAVLEPRSPGKTAWSPRLREIDETKALVLEQEDVDSEMTEDAVHEVPSAEGWRAVVPESPEEMVKEANGPRQSYWEFASDWERRVDLD